MQTPTPAQTSPITQTRLTSRHDLNRNAEKLAVPSQSHPLAGFWKSGDCSHDFGLAIAPAGEGLYSISFCGPGGCFVPGTYRPNSPLVGDRSYRVVNNNTIDVEGRDGFTRYIRCSLSQPIAAAVPVGKVAQTARIDSNDAAAGALLGREAIRLSQQGTEEALRGASTKWEEALKLYRQAGDNEMQGFVLNMLGRVYSELGELHKTLECYTQSLSLLRAVGSRGGEAVLLMKIGAFYLSLGEQQKALEYYSQSLPLSRAVGERDVEAYTLNSMGTVYLGLGENQKALEYYSQSLLLARASDSRAVEALNLSSIGRVYSQLGEKQKALEYYNQSLSLSRAVRDRYKEALNLTSIGRVYSQLGEKQKALEYYNQSLSL
ncbi:tetratricopeptide repeat protein, partial [Microcoleus sp. S13C4]|uniref:tetratricopeptide repeat protein n=1 Tax=Microcoleus sp. S13C4 TaxID=3055410 RepID=UPI002FD55479